MLTPATAGPNKPVAPPVTPLLGLFLLLAATRVPLLFHGFGSNNDSWRNVVAVFRMQALGHYVPSRVPGFPVFEAIMAVLVPFGSIATNGATIAFGLVGVYFFYRVASQVVPRSAFLLAIGFGFSGPIWVDISQSKDYAIGLAFFLVAFDAALSRRYRTAAVFLALATGCRVTYSLTALSFITLLVFRKERATSIAAWLSLYLALSLALFLPVFLTPDPETTHLDRHLDSHFHHAHVTLGTILPAVRAGAVYIFGKLGTVIFGLALAGQFVGWMRSRWSSHRRQLPAPSLIRRVSTLDPVTAFGVVTIALVTSFYFMIPYSGAYLLPLIPSMLLLLARTFPRWLLTIVLIAAVSDCLVSTVPRAGREIPVAGQFLSELDTRKADLDSTAALAALRPSRPTVYVVGQFSVHRLFVLRRSEVRPTDTAWSYQKWQGVALWSRSKRIGYATYLTPEQSDSLRRTGWDIVDRLPKYGIR